MLGHGLTKSTLFISSGEIAHAEGTTEIANVKALLARRPILGGIFGCGLLALLGLPPFSLFISEFTMARAEVDVRAVVGGRSLTRMPLGDLRLDHQSRATPPPGSDVSSPVSLRARAVVVPLVTALAACAFIGVSSWPLLSTLTRGGTRGGTMNARRRALDIAPSALHGYVEQTLRDGHRLALIAAHDDEEFLRVVYVLLSGPPDQRLELTVRLDRGSPHVPP